METDVDRVIRMLRYMAENAWNVPLEPFARHLSAVEGITQQGRNASDVRMEALPKRVQPVVRCALRGRME